MCATEHRRYWRPWRSRPEKSPLMSGTAAHPSTSYPSWMTSSVPILSELHVILDNLNIHKNAAAQQWLHAHARVHFHYIPTHASWLNLIECFFSILAKQGLSQSVHRSKTELKTPAPLPGHYNANSNPFTWTKGPSPCNASSRQPSSIRQPTPKSVGAEGSDETNRFYKGLTGRCTSASFCAWREEDLRVATIPSALTPLVQVIRFVLGPEEGLRVATIPSALTPLVQVTPCRP